MSKDTITRRLLWKGEAVVILPFPATVQWTLLLAWLQKIVEPLPQRSDEHKNNRTKSKQAEPSPVRVTVKRRGVLLNQETQGGTTDTGADAGGLDESDLERLNRQLQEELLALSSRAYAEAMALLLRKMGYADVQLLPRDKRKLCGGTTLRARSRTGAGETLLLAQVKQYRAPVARRFVDELRGAMLRRNAQAGLLITTSRFPRASVAASREDAHLPVTLLEGTQVRELLVQYGLGVEELTDGMQVVDRAFFAQLERGARRAETGGFNSKRS